MRRATEPVRVVGETKTIDFWQHFREVPVTCPGCGWCGRPAEGEDASQEPLHVRCPVCDRTLFIIPLLAIEATRVAIAAVSRPAQTAVSGRTRSSSTRPAAPA